MKPKAEIARFIRKDESGRGISVDAIDYWFEVKAAPTGEPIQVPGKVSRTARATHVQGARRELSEKDFIAVAMARLEERLREGFVPMPQMRPDDYDEVLAIDSGLFVDMARRVLR